MHRRSIDTILSIGVRSRARSRRGGPPSPVGRDPGYRPGLRDRHADIGGLVRGRIGMERMRAAWAACREWLPPRSRASGDAPCLDVVCASVRPAGAGRGAVCRRPGYRAAHGRSRSAERVVRRAGRPRRPTRGRHVVEALGWQCPSLPAGVASVSSTCCPSGVMVKRHWVTAGRPACSHRW